MHHIFNEFALLLGISAIAGMISLWLRQPILIAYIVVGILVGPSGLGVVSAYDQIELLSQVGVTILLFVVGLKLDLQHIKNIGSVALATGLGQLTFTAVIGFLIILLMGKSPMESLYVAVALTFSSTIIIVKLLSDKREIDSLHGRIAIGFLIVQDLAVIVAMMVMSTLRTDSNSGLAMLGITILAKLACVTLAMYVLMRYVLPTLTKKMAHSQELLLIFTIAWGTGFAALGEWTGFSKEAGAFLAGFSLASGHYRDAISARLTGVRDFLLLFFFIDLGAKIDFSTLGNDISLSIVLSLFVLIGNPLIVMAIMGYMGYRNRTGFLAGLTVAQISEFSIVFVAMGISLGHIKSDTLGLTTLVGLVTIAISTYMIIYSHAFYASISRWLTIFERKKPYRELDQHKSENAGADINVVIFGLGRYGGQLAVALQKSGINVMGVDFDPEVCHQLRRKGLNVRYGDSMESEFIESLPIRQTPWIVSTLPDVNSNEKLLHALKQQHYPGKISVVSRGEQEHATLRKMKVDLILYPMQDAIQHAAETIVAAITHKEATHE